MQEQYPDPVAANALIIGTLRFDRIGQSERRCGIHGDPTGSGRCASCDDEEAG